MHSFRPLALLLALAFPATHAVPAQSSSSALTTQEQAQEQAQNQTQGQAQQPATESTQQMSVQARIRLRREQRRSTAIHDAYDHLFDTYVSLGYLRFVPGPSEQRTTFYAWNFGIARYYSERLGVDLDARGNYGVAYVGTHPLTQGAFTRPKISQYDVLLGPTYRFYEQPKFDIAARLLGGVSIGNFTGDTNGEGSLCTTGTTGCLLYPDGATFAISAGIAGEYNIAPDFALRLTPEYFFTGFGSTVQASRGFTGAVVYRFGKR